jgi:hypothetical protein
LRTTMIQLAWLWVRHQPRSILTLWFHQRVQLNGGRVRKRVVPFSQSLVQKKPRQVTGQKSTDSVGGNLIRFVLVPDC